MSAAASVAPVRAGVGTALIALALAVLAPDPVALWRDAPQRRAAALLDPSLRVPFASVLLRSDQSLAPGDRVLGLRLDGDPGLHTPRDRVALLAALAGPGPVRLEVRGPRGAAQRLASVSMRGPRRVLAEQWPVALAGAALLFFALCCVVGGRHPVATPLFAVSLCLGTGLLAALDLVLPGDAGIAGLGAGRARLGLLAWTGLPAALLHLAARFPIVVPRWRRPGLAALSYAPWAMPALLAQLRFDEPAVVHAVERVSLTASFGAGAVLVAACLAPGRRLLPIERVRARALVAGLVGAGAGPLAAFVAPAQPQPDVSAALALGALALPTSLGWAVARYRLLDPPVWLARALRSAGALLAALLFSAGALGALRRRDAGATSPDVTLALATAAVYQGLRATLDVLGRRRGPRGGAPEALLARAGRELAGARSPERVLARLRELLLEELGARAVEIVAAEGADAAGALGARGRARWGCSGAQRSARVLELARAEDPDAEEPEVVLHIAPRLGAAQLAVVAPRVDGLPYAPEALRALDDVGRLAALALDDAASSAALEQRVAERTAALRRALDDRSALVAAAARIQAAGEADHVRAAVAALLGERTAQAVRRSATRPARARLAAELSRPPAGREWLFVEDVGAERAADLAPQIEALGALANLALERLHLLDGLKLEVSRQARALASASTGRRHAEFVRRVAHELRKPNEEIRQRVAPLVTAAGAGPARDALADIERASHELARRLDCLLSRQGLRCDARRVDLVRLVDEAARRISLLGARRRFEVAHAGARLPLVGDPVRLLSLVENLLDNAVKATAEGGRVCVRTALADAGGARWVRLEVEDDGPGVPRELAEEIFEPGVGVFQGGFGLGLALCRDVAALHGGRIEVASRPGSTLFRVVLPQLREALP